MSEKTKISTVMFDLDGTLLPFEQDDFVKAYFKRLCQKLAPFGYEKEPTIKAVWAGTAAMVRNDGSRKNSEAFWETFRQMNAGKPDVKELCDEFYTNEFDGAKESLKYVPDRKPMIEKLKSAGLKIILATNPIFPLDGVKTRLSWIGLSEDDFILITHYDNSTFCKPNPRYYEEILKKTGDVPERCLMVGNNVSEDMSAANLGMKVFFCPEFAENPNNDDVSVYMHGTPEEAAEYAIGCL